MNKFEGFYVDTKSNTFRDRTGRPLMTYHDSEFAEHVENLLLERWISRRLPEPIPVKGKQGLWNWDEVCADCELPFLHDRYNAFCNECGDRAYREIWI